MKKTKLEKAIADITSEIGFLVSATSKEMVKNGLIEDSELISFIFSVHGGNLIMVLKSIQRVSPGSENIPAFYLMQQLMPFVDKSKLRSLLNE